MNDFIKIVQMSNVDIESYVKDKIISLSSSILDNNEISLDEDGVIYPGWININDVYRPSGYRSKGFVLTKDFYVDWCKYIRDNFGMIDIKKLSSNIDAAMIIKLINMFVTVYFGVGYNEKRRKELYSYGNWQVVNESINIDKLKNENVARCIEKSAAFNGIANLIGFDSSLVLSDASLDGGEKIGHAYCLLNLNGQYLICDPTFHGANSKGKGIYYTFELNKGKVVFDSGKFDDVNPQVVEYDFPWNEFEKNNGILHK